MIHKLFNLFKPSLQAQVQDELYQANRDLLEAEGILENAQARVNLYKARVDRLEARRNAAVTN